MPRFAYVNHQYIPHDQAVLSIDDRGTQFGDAVYEVISVLRGDFLDADGHLARLQRSLNGLNIPMPMSVKALELICKQLVKRNGLNRGLVYMQISRGTMNRNHVYPQKDLIPNVIITTHRMPLKSDSSQLEPIKIKSYEDTRWGRVDIKTTMLLPNCLSKTDAYNQGCKEILFVKDGHITECASSNFFYVDKKGILHTAPKGNILMGCTRKILIDCAKELQIPVEENTFSLEDAKTAQFAFVSSASSFMCPVSHIDDTEINMDIPQKWKNLFDLYIQRALNL